MSYDPKKKYFLIHIEVISGEREFGEKFVIEAKDLKEAEEKLNKIVPESYGNGDEKPDEYGNYDFFDIGVKVGSIHETNPMEFFERNISG